VPPNGERAKEQSAKRSEQTLPLLTLSSGSLPLAVTVVVPWSLSLQGHRFLIVGSMLMRWSHTFWLRRDRTFKKDPANKICASINLESRRLQFSKKRWRSLDRTPLIDPPDEEEALGVRRSTANSFRTSASASSSRPADKDRESYSGPPVRCLRWLLHRFDSTEIRDVNLIQNVTRAQIQLATDCDFCHSVSHFA